MNFNEDLPDNGKRFEEEVLGLESLETSEQQFVVDLALALRNFQRYTDDRIVINNYSVKADKFIIIMEHHSNLKE